MKLDFVTADKGTLAGLASNGLLDLLTHFGPVHIPDLVALESTFDGKPYATEISEWISAGEQTGKVIVQDTEVGLLLTMARQVDPEYPIGNAGDNAIRDWLIDNIGDTQQSAMLVYERARVVNLLMNYACELNDVMFTVRAFLDVCEKKRLIESGAKAWEGIKLKVPDLNQKIQVSLSGRFAR